MKKLIVAVLALVVVAALAFPAWFGVMAEEAIVEQMNAATVETYVRSEVVEYERGWFGSTGRIDVRLSDTYVDGLLDGSDGDELDALLRDGKLTFTFDVSHGPVILAPQPYFGISTSVVRLQAPNAEVAQWLERLNLPYLMEARSRTGFDGVAHVVADVPAVEHRLDDGSQLTFSGLTLEGEYDASARHVTSRAGMDLLEVSGNGTEVRVESFSMDGDNTIVSEVVWLGTVDAGIERVRISNAAMSANDVEMTGLKMSTRVDSPADDGRVNASVIYAVDNVSSLGMAVANMKLGVALNNVAASTFEAYNDWTRSAMSSGTGVDEAALTEATADLVHKFLSDGPEIVVDPLAVEYNGQPLRAKLNVQIDPSALPPAAQLAAADPMLWVRLITAAGELEGSKELVRTLVVQNMMESARAQVVQQGADVPDHQVEALAGQQADATLAMLVGQGMISEQGDLYRTELSFTGGTLSVNGKPMPVPGL